MGVRADAQRHPRAEDAQINLCLRFRHARLHTNTGGKAHACGTCSLALNQHFYLTLPTHIS